jgi:hypothetical protein
VTTTSLVSCAGAGVAAVASRMGAARRRRVIAGS